MKTSGDQRPRRMLRLLGGLVRTWWQADRVRISPDEGRLLRLEAGALIRLENRWNLVRSRTVVRTSDESLVLYICQNDAGHSQLRVEPLAETGRCRVRWTVGGVDRILGPEDLEVYARTLAVSVELRGVQ